MLWNNIKISILFKNEMDTPPTSLLSVVAIIRPLNGTNLRCVWINIHVNICLDTAVSASPYQPRITMKCKHFFTLYIA